MHDNSALTARRTVQSRTTVVQTTTCTALWGAPTQRVRNSYLKPR